MGISTVACRRGGGAGGGGGTNAGAAAFYATGYPHTATDELSAEELTDDGSNIYEQANPPPGPWQPNVVGSSVNTAVGGGHSGHTSGGIPLGGSQGGYGGLHGQGVALGSLVSSLAGSQRYTAHQQGGGPPGNATSLAGQQQQPNACHNQIITRKSNGTGSSGLSFCLSL
ncbi:spidroin-1-like [Varroa jacobsoni]|uniref:spidroin-1-like n=1 Tax=Varroa jacobsoni TaxID=62625 RepID=UPI000BF85088|nr:spidroin-1-like [Varroa jacobsoni]